MANEGREGQRVCVGQWRHQRRQAWWNAGPKGLRGLVAAPTAASVVECWSPAVSIWLQRHCRIAQRRLPQQHNRAKLDIR